MTEAAPLRAVAARALALVDLTDLTDGCSPEAVEALCAKAVTPHGPVAAVCIWPVHVALARRRLAGSRVKIATVVNFPGGGTDTEAVAAETRAAIADGADEIDLVMPYRSLMAGDAAVAVAQVERIRAVCAAPVGLKVIIESGVLAEPATIRRASEIALAAGADFVKTSTGKVAINATLPAARIMLEAIRACGRPAGFKAAGGIRTAADAAAYLALADEIMGPEWVSPATFRFGASGLLGDLLAVLDGGGAAPTTASY